MTTNETRHGGRSLLPLVPRFINTTTFVASIFGSGEEELRLRSVQVDRQLPVRIVYKGKVLRKPLRLDMRVEKLARRGLRPSCRNRELTPMHAN